MRCDTMDALSPLKRRRMRCGKIHIYPSQSRGNVAGLPKSPKRPTERFHECPMRFSLEPAETEAHALRQNPYLSQSVWWQCGRAHIYPEGRPKRPKRSTASLHKRPLRFPPKPTAAEMHALRQHPYLS